VKNIKQVLRTAALLAQAGYEAVALLVHGRSPHFNEPACPVPALCAQELGSTPLDMDIGGQKVSLPLHFS